MVGSWRLAFGVVVTSLVTASAASAFGGRGGFYRPPTVSYYYAVPYYCLPTPLVIPVPDAPADALCEAVASGSPSNTGEPPLSKTKASNDPRKPVIVASHAPALGKAPAKNRCRVGFWNLSGREVTVTIEGKAFTLSKDRAVTLDLEREFTWQVAGRPQNVERLPEAQATHEVLIRE